MCKMSFLFIPSWSIYFSHCEWVRGPSSIILSAVIHLCKNIVKKPIFSRACYSYCLLMFPQKRTMPLFWLLTWRAFQYLHIYNFTRNINLLNILAFVFVKSCVKLHWISILVNLAWWFIVQILVNMIFFN